MRILAVDDDQFILELLQNMLEREEGFEVEVCGSSEEAKAILEKDHSFNIVITDVVMPGEDGTRLARYIKDKDPSFPVIAITGGIENARQDYVHYADMFADKTLAKPFNKDELVETINRLAA